ncbi:ATP-binding protein [Nocardia sp. NPDC005745]|uniref:sensor histidine kinase n=1 Tax=Nocardia sp. NPDC005745 TaxID=3157061 RepID=UPI0033E23402
MRSSKSIRTRVLAIALIPGLALVGIGTTFVALQLDESLTAREWSEGLSLQIDPSLDMVDALRSERTYSFRALGGDAQATADLPDVRHKTDIVTQKIIAIGREIVELNPAATARSGPVFFTLTAQMPQIRHSVDTGQATAADVDDFYTRLASFINLGLEGSARTSPESAASADEIVTSELIRAADLHARAVGRAWDSLANRGSLTLADRQIYVRMIGAFHNRLEVVADQLTSGEKARYDRLVAGNEWRAMTAAEESLALTGKLPSELDEWLRDQNAVGAELRALEREHFRYAERIAKESADALLEHSVAAGIGVLLVAVATFGVAAGLAGRMVRRLRSLRTKTLELAEQTLPSIVQRLHDGQAVDLDAELILVDDGVDEIGQVAHAFNTAQRAAVTAAAGEARARAGIKRVFLDIARRSQVIVHQQLKVLDAAEAKQDDPEHLELLFQLDHLTTRARRNAENLLILGNGQPGRRWRNPVPIVEVVRAAISETRDFTRVSAVRLPEVEVAGAVVADLIHLLAELIDNAASFSPPDSPVSVRGNLVGKGMVVEVEDQGLGIRFEERERLNEILREPSGFQQMALEGHRNLGLFVVGQLAHRHGIAVNLLESAYGGVKAIALVPDGLLVNVSEGTSDADAAPSADSRGRPAFTPRVIVDPVPRMAGTTAGTGSTWPLEERSTDPASPLVRTASRADIHRPVGDLIPSPGRSKVPLPRRERLTHLAPQLRLPEDKPAPEESSQEEARRRSPAQARSSMTAFQRGSRDGRYSSRGRE